MSRVPQPLRHSGGSMYILSIKEPAIARKATTRSWRVPTQILQRGRITFLKTCPACSSVNACQVGRYGYAASPERCHTAMTAVSSRSSNGRMVMLASFTVNSHLASRYRISPPTPGYALRTCRAIPSAHGLQEKNDLAPNAPGCHLLDPGKRIADSHRPLALASSGITIDGTGDPLPSRIANGFHSLSRRTRD